MKAKKYLLMFPKNESDKPIVYHLVKDFGLKVNIYRAKVTPEEEGYLVIDMEGADEHIQAGLEFIRTENIELLEADKGIRWNRKICTHCGNCQSHCPTKALTFINRKTMEMGFDADLCIQCLNCIKTCPFGACSSLFEENSSIQ
jgi:ferredoxin